LKAAAFFATAFACASALFLLPLAELLLDRRARRAPRFDPAFAASALALTVLLLAGAVHAVADLVPVVESLLAAVLASFVAIAAEQGAALSAEADDGPERMSLARLMALSAAHDSLLARLAGRPGTAGDNPAGRS
jgi:hypothetical protein